jgi:peptide/nickel transport system substrate-binding protein
MKKFLILVLLVTLAIQAYATGSKETEAVKTGTGTAKKEISIAPSLGFTSMDVQVTTSATDKSVYVMVFDTLVARDSDSGEIVPALAESWRQVSDRKLEFKLRRNVSFHNGGNFTANDVKFTFDRAKGQSGTRSRLATVGSVTVVDDYTIELDMLAMDVDIIYKLTDPGFSILSAQAFATLPVTEAYKVGTGAFTYGEWVQGDRLTLNRFDRYWGELPKTSSIIIRVIPEAASRLIALQTGEIDICIDPSAVDLHYIAKDPKLTLMQIPSTNIRYIGVNMGKAPFNNPLVRQAVAYAIKRDDFIALVYEGNAMATNNVMHPEYMFYKEIDGYAYDPMKAKALLAEAGFPNGFSATIHSSQGTTQKAVATVLQAQLAEVGIKLNIQALETATFNASVAAGQPFDMMVNGWGGYAIGPDNALRPHFYSTGSSNRYQIKDKYIDELLDKGLASTVIADRVRIYNELQAYIIKQAVFLPIAVELINVGTKAGLKGFRLPNGLFHDFRYVNIMQ